MTDPFFSIVIATFNSDATVERALESIANQTFASYEVMVVDNQSSDRTVSIVSQFQERLPTLRTVSEPDDGVYDAINKGIRMARGAWVYILGSDDSLAGPKTLETAHEYLCATEKDLVYGLVRLVGAHTHFKKRRRLGGRYSLAKLTKVGLCQQACFYRREIFARLGPFNTRYKIWADWEFAIRAFSEGLDAYIPMVVANFAGGGLSSQGPDQAFLADGVKTRPLAGTKTRVQDLQNPKVSPTSTVLFTWEIGQGLGHVMPLVPIARRLRDSGHKVIFALRDVRSLGSYLQGEGFAVIQAPTHPDQFIPSRTKPPQTMSDVLALFGFSSERSLRGLATAWESTLNLCKPDVLVASYAPLSLLCARKVGIPTVNMTLPFELPPAIHPCPSLRHGTTATADANDDAVIAAVNSMFGANYVTAVHEVFEADAVVMMSFVELDPYGPREGIHYYGSLFVDDVGPKAVWPDSAGKKVFAYLHANLPNIDDLRVAIQTSDHSYCIVLRNANPDLLRKWEAPNTQVTSESVHLEGALTECDAVLCYGGHGLVSASLLHGKPMAFYLQNLESYITAKQVAKHGIGLMARAGSASDAMRCVNAVLSNAAYREQAKRFAAVNVRHTAKDTGAEIAAAIATMV